MSASPVLAESGPWVPSAASRAEDLICCKAMAWAEQQTVEQCVAEGCGPPPKPSDFPDSSIGIGWRMATWLVNAALFDVDAGLASSLAPAMWRMGAEPWRLASFDARFGVARRLCDKRFAPTIDPAVFGD